jgi:ER-bound oxygenase mpaB/B'/Rubber oxygenase, catalytic domain
VLGYASVGNKPLVLAGGLLERAPKRLNETARYVRSVCVSGGLAPFGAGFSATLHVRLMHAHVRAMAQKSPRWRTSDYGTPINQHDMVATVLLFSWVLMDGLEKLGVHLSEEEAEDYTHLWRYAGHLMGVSPELLPASRAEAKRLVDLIADTQGPPDEDARTLVHALLQAGTQEAKTPKEHLQAKRSTAVLQAAATVLHGPAYAKELGFAGTPVGSFAPILRRLVQSTEAVRKRSDLLAALQLKRGMAYWDAIATRGYALYGTPFLLPG